MLKRIIKKLLPKKILFFYHWFLAQASSFYYGMPSEKLIVIGVTGTNGKTTTVNFIGQYLEALGQKVGFISTVNFKINEKEWLNDKKMTMLGRFATQKLLKEMLKAGCKYVVIESSSQGIEQYRHVGINYDVLVFTNLTPEHIEAHGGFENYRAAKEKLFYHLGRCRHKKIAGKKIAKVIISNSDDIETERLCKVKSDNFFTYGLKAKADYLATNIISQEDKLSFQLKGVLVENNFLGDFNVYNILASISAVSILGFNLKQIAENNLKGVPGRQEWIKTGQDFSVLIDYAPEPESLKQLYHSLGHIKYRRLIHVIGSCGGGRDRARQPILGKMAAQKADIVIVTNEDPYDDDPEAIIANVAQGALENGKILNENLFKVSERRDAIEMALKLAKKDDIVLITGKGAEQFICMANEQKVPWDDRVVAREVLEKLQ